MPSERSSGRSVRRGSITKTGNAHARRLLTEAAWNYRFPARMSNELRERSKVLPRTDPYPCLEGAAAFVRAICPAVLAGACRPTKSVWPWRVSWLASCGPSRTRRHLAVDESQ